MWVILHIWTYTDVDGCKYVCLTMGWCVYRLRAVMRTATGLYIGEMEQNRILRLKIAIRAAVIQALLWIQAHRQENDLIVD
jgi:hypothetical protein